jgi:hypothetical protein
MKNHPKVVLVFHDGPEAESTGADYVEPYLIRPHAILGPELPAGCDL